MIGNDHSIDMAGKHYRNTYKIDYAGGNLVKVSQNMT